MSLVVNRIDSSGVFATSELEQVADRVVKHRMALVLAGAGWRTASGILPRSEAYLLR